MKRVVVTGIGAVTPIGNDIQSLYEGLREGRNGIGYITRFDPEEYKVKVAAEVKDFDPLQYIEKNQLRKMDLYTQYAVAAA
ncbi:MAG TPA: beta-ketoacyl-[acyl-carrier-protein] synthase II, partial [Clostridiales bacterium]|nr:beta-ketoacyl-[acyl-carrier-protein] synthase II [Clostridiales bacterium]